MSQKWNQLYEICPCNLASILPCVKRRLNLNERHTRIKWIFSQVQVILEWLDIVIGWYHSRHLIDWKSIETGQVRYIRKEADIVKYLKEITDVSRTHCEYLKCTPPHENYESVCSLRRTYKPPFVKCRPNDSRYWLFKMETELYRLILPEENEE